MENIDKLKEELKLLKKVLRVPRYHFKFLEKLEYEAIASQMKDVKDSSLDKENKRQNMSQDLKRSQNNIRYS